jgi:hydroxymethylpyrimidine/phosphomethylpyrimidine kinase
VALTIAASDSSSGAGIQADLAVFREVGVYGVCAVTNVTSQNSQGVQHVNKVPPRTIASQIDSVTRDFGIAACKVGMLLSPQAVSVVAERIRRREIPNVVLDPVTKAKHGETLLNEPAVKRLRRALLPLALVITPNTAEAELLTGIAVTDLETARKAAERLVEMGAKWALVKGGHAEGDPVDLLSDGAQVIEFCGKRLDRNMHGTGCVMSAAIAARLALGDTVPDAVRFAKDYVTKAIEHSIRLGKGRLDYFVGGGASGRNPSPEA